jgi:hypothetical protein
MEFCDYIKVLNDLFEVGAKQWMKVEHDCGQCGQSVVNKVVHVGKDDYRD